MELVIHKDDDGTITVCEVREVEIATFGSLDDAELFVLARETLGRPVKGEAKPVADPPAAAAAGDAAQRTGPDVPAHGAAHPKPGPGPGYAQPPEEERFPKTGGVRFAAPAPPDEDRSRTFSDGEQLRALRCLDEGRALREVAEEMGKDWTVLRSLWAREKKRRKNDGEV